MGMGFLTSACLPPLTHEDPKWCGYDNNDFAGLDVIVPFEVLSHAQRVGSDHHSLFFLPPGIVAWQRQSRDSSSTLGGLRSAHSVECFGQCGSAPSNQEVDQCMHSSTIVACQNLTDLKTCNARKDG
jgi:hypothetical protein